MRATYRVALAALVLSGAAVAACVFPTERDASVHVSLTPIHILFRGSDTVAIARAWHLTGPADSQPIPNVVFAWSTSDPSVATVDAAGHIVGLKSGGVIITAAAANFDKEARAAADTLRVAAPLEVDSVRPRIVKYGQILSVYGVGVDSIFSASLAGAALIAVPFADTAYAAGTERRNYWVPPPAHTDSLFFLGFSGGSGVFDFVHGDTTRVVEQDIFEPDDTTPRAIDLDAPPPFPPFPTLVFTNPALAFETLKRGLGTDWYRFAQAEKRDVTVILSAPQVKGTFVTYLTDSLGWNGATQKFFIGRDSWSFGPSSHFCHGAAFAPSEALGDSVIVAFRALKAGTLDALAAYGVPGRYGLTVIAGYQSELPPDKHEDDNSCNAADRDTVQVGAGGYRDTLAIENPHDVDWIRFHYTQQALSTAQVRLHALPGTHPDSLKDLDLYVVKVPQPGDAAVQVLAADTSSASDADLRPGLATGDYYLVVVDFGGASTLYEICVGTITALGAGPCAGAAFPAPPQEHLRSRRATAIAPLLTQAASPR